MSQSDDILEELDLAPRKIGPGRPPKLVTATYERDLTEADIAALSIPRGVKAPSLIRIRASHHALARCLAAGMKPGEASLITGYAPSRVSILQGDPTFQALVEDYRAEARSISADLGERMTGMSLDAMELLQEKLHDHPEEFTVSTLLDVIKTFADRTGHGPNQQLTLKMDRDFIDRPPRESFEDWEKRRAAELGSPIKDLN